MRDANRAINHVRDEIRIDVADKRARNSTWKDKISALQ
jgi:hypothetical protein